MEGFSTGERFSVNEGGGDERALMHQSSCENSSFNGPLDLPGFGGDHGGSTEFCDGHDRESVDLFGQEGKQDQFPGGNEDTVICQIDIFQDEDGVGTAEEPPVAGSPLLTMGGARDGDGIDSKEPEARDLRAEPGRERWINPRMRGGIALRVAGSREKRTRPDEESLRGADCREMRAEVLRSNG